MIRVLLANPYMTCRCRPLIKGRAHAHGVVRQIRSHVPTKQCVSCFSLFGDKMQRRMKKEGEEEEEEERETILRQKRC